MALRNIVAPPTATGRDDSPTPSNFFRSSSPATRQRLVTNLFVADLSPDLEYAGRRSARSGRNSPSIYHPTTERDQSHLTPNSSHLTPSPSHPVFDDTPSVGVFLSHGQSFATGGVSAPPVQPVQPAPPSRQDSLPPQRPSEDSPPIVVPLQPTPVTKRKSGPRSLSTTSIAVEGSVDCLESWCCMQRGRAITDDKDRGIERTLLRVHSFQSLDSYDLDPIERARRLSRHYTKQLDHPVAAHPGSYPYSGWTPKVRPPRTPSRPHHRGKSETPDRSRRHQTDLSPPSTSLRTIDDTPTVSIHYHHVSQQGIAPLNFAAVTSHAHSPLSFSARSKYNPDTKSVDHCELQPIPSPGDTFSLLPSLSTSDWGGVPKPIFNREDKAFVNISKSNLVCQSLIDTISIPIFEFIHLLKDSDGLLQLNFIGELSGYQLMFHLIEGILSASFFRLNDSHPDGIGDQDIKIVYKISSGGKNSSTQTFTDRYVRQNTIGKLLKVETGLVVALEDLHNEGTIQILAGCSNQVVHPSSVKRTNYGTLEFQLCADCFVVCGKRKFPVSRYALMSASPYFQKILKEKVKRTAYLMNSDPDAMELLLHLIHTAECDSLAKLDDLDLLLATFEAAVEYSVNEYVDKIALTIANRLSEENLRQIYRCAKSTKHQPLLSICRCLRQIKAAEFPPDRKSRAS